MKYAFETFILSLLSTCTPAGGVIDSPSLSKVEESWANTKSYRARFKQIIESKRLIDREESTGTVAVQKPGKIRWEVTSEGRVQILNGNKLVHIHIPKRRKANVVDIYENISKDVDTKSLSFLSGVDTLKKSYLMNIVKESERSVSIRLVPKDSPGTPSYIAEFDKSGYLLRSLVTNSSDSTVRTEFSDIETNVSYGPEVFDYKPGPQDVVTINK